MYTFSDGAMEHLNYVLKAFASACHKVESSKVSKFNLATDFDTETLLNPSRYFFFQFRDKFCQIERIGQSNEFCLYCHNFVPDKLSRTYNVDVLLINEYMDERFGRFNIDTAIQTFASVCSNMVSFVQPVLIY